MQKVQKAIEITDALISFVSLVDKPANMRPFLIAKADKGKAGFQTYGKIIKVDAEAHYVTGIVYEPMVEDSHGNFMTADEIQKAAYWYARNAQNVDLQHNFTNLPGAAVVETWVTKGGETINGAEVQPGTWLMTVEVIDETIWAGVVNGDITGFSMGGIGKYAVEDTDISTVEGGVTVDEVVAKTENLTILQRLGKALGLEVVAKGAVADKFNESQKRSNFWNAMDALETTLKRYNWYSDKTEFESDETTIREALQEFSDIMVQVLAADNVGLTLKAAAAAAPGMANVAKAGKKMSGANKKKLDDLLSSMQAFAQGFDDDEGKEETEVTKQEIQTLVTDTVAAEVKKAVADVVKQAGPTAQIDEGDTDEAVAKAAKPDGKPEAVTKEEVQTMVTASVADAMKSVDIAGVVKAAMEPLMKARGIGAQIPEGAPSGQAPVKKSYLSGVL